MRRVLFLAGFIFCACAASEKPWVIPDAVAAQTAVTQHLFGTIKAEHGFAVAPRLRLDRPVEGLGEAGDPIWEVRRTDIHDGFNVDGIFWVNARTGRILQVHPESLGAAR